MVCVKYLYVLHVHVKDLYVHVHAKSAANVEETTRHFFQRLSITLVKGNSSLIMRRMPTCTDARVDGDVDE